MIKKHDILIISTIINIAFLLIYMFVFVPNYEINDDIAIYLLSAGAFGKANSHLVFSHHLLGLLYKWLSFLYDGIKWYSLFQYIGLFLAFESASYLLLDNWGKIKGAIFSCIINILIGYQAYVCVQYTKVAAIVTISGIVFFYYYLKKEGISKKTIFGAVLAIFGSMFRFYMALIVGVLFAVGAIIDNIVLIDETGRIRIGLETKRVVALSTLAIIMLVLYGADGLFYDKDWKSYKQWQLNMSSLTDFGCPTYAENSELYDSLGISEFDIAYYATFNMGDRDMLTDEVVKQIVDAKSAKDFSWSVNRDAYIDVVKNMKERIFGVTTAFILVLYLFVISDRKSKLIIVANIFTFFCIYYVFTVTGRKFINRVDVGLIYAVMVCLLSFCSESVIISKRKWLELSVTFALIPMMLYSYNYLNVKTILAGNDELKNILEQRKEYRELFKQISADSENMYITSIQGMGGEILNAYGIWDTVEEGELGNIYIDGGWCSGAPSAKEGLKRHGLSNGFSDVINADNVYIIEENTDNDYFKYIRDNYTNGSMEVIETGKIGKWSIYQIKSQAE